MDIFHGGDIMKVGEARGIYSSVLKSYNQQKFKLSKQRNELKERMESTPDGKTLYADAMPLSQLFEVLFDSSVVVKYPIF